MLARGGNPSVRPWTTKELQLVRDLYLTDRQRLFSLLAHRSPNAIQIRASLIGASTKRPPWSDEDKDTLARLWKERTPIALIAERLHRTERAVHCEAKAIGLTATKPEGLEHLYQAVKRTGFNGRALLVILAAAEAQVEGYHGSLSDRGARGRIRFVKPEQVDAAVKAWLSTETVYGAARAREMDNTTLRRWLLEARAIEPRTTNDRKPRRVPTEVIDRVVAERRARKEQDQ